MGTLTRRAGNAATAAAFVAGMVTESVRQVRAELAKPPERALPPWHAPHRCTDHARQVYTWQQLTRHGTAVWLVQECQVCGEPWDVLSDASDEQVIVASVYPVWAVAGCGLCTQECAGEPCRCPCHAQGIDTPAVPAKNEARQLEAVTRR